MKTRIEKLFQETAADFAKESSLPADVPAEFDLLLSKDPEHGDFSVNIAFKLAKVAKKKPADIAHAIKVIVDKKTEDRKEYAWLEKVEVAGAGYLNIFLAKQSRSQVLRTVRKLDAQFGVSDYGAQQKVLVEFVSANPTGPLTIAHGRQAAIGDSLVRILRAIGYSVEAEYYLNDGGRQMNLLGQSLWARYCEHLGFEAQFPEDGYKGAYLLDLAKQLAEEKKDALIQEEKSAAIAVCREYAGEAMMRLIREDLEAVGVQFDHYFSEQTLYQNKEVERTLDVLSKGGFLYEQDGALWFRSTDFGDDKDRVVKKSTGEMTYLTPDIAYHHYKFERGFKWLINLLGPDHHSYVTRLKAACQALGHSPDEVNVLIVQLTKLFRNGEPVRMSTRAGEFVTLRELIDEVGSDATRFFFVMRRIESPLDFDLELAKQKTQDNPVYYLQYAHARIFSLIQYSKQAISETADLELLSSPDEIELIKCIAEFPDLLIRAGKTLEPYRVVDYLRGLAAFFHKFYAHHRVVGEDPEVTAARLYLCDCVRIVMRNGLNLLGVSQPESM